MKTVQIILLILTSLSGCANKSDTVTITTDQTKADTTTMVNTTALTYLALGDSYTIGQSVPADQSYPLQLTNALNSSFVSSKLNLHVGDPTIIATTGWTTDNLINAINNSGLAGKKYSFITVLIGVNDQFQGLSIDNYKVKFTELLHTAINFANGDINRVFVISIPDYGVTPFAGAQDAVIGPQIDLFNAANQAISVKAGVNYLNITDLSREAATNSTLIANDGLHPSGAMYALWVQRLEPMVIAKIKN